MKVVLISCVKKKLPGRARVQDLYVSTLFRSNLEFARSLKPDAIYILKTKIAAFFARILAGRCSTGPRILFWRNGNWI